MRKKGLHVRGHKEFRLYLGSLSLFAYILSCVFYFSPLLATIVGNHCVFLFFISLVVLSVTNEIAFGMLCPAKSITKACSLFEKKIKSVSGDEQWTLISLAPTHALGP